jgi:protein O-mannosyl-transferase
MTDNPEIPTDAAPTPANDWQLLIDIHGKWISAVGLLILTLVTFSPTLSGLFIWADKSHILHEIDVSSVDGLRAIWLEPGTQVRYEPLTQTSYWLEYQLWGQKPAGYHFDNVFLQALTALILYSILRRLKVPGAWVVAAIFAVHPIQAEPASWIGARATLLGGLWYMASAFVFLRFFSVALPPPRPLDAPQPKLALRLPDDPLRLYVLATVLFLAALLSDPSTATLPLALLLVIWWKRPPRSLRFAAATIPLLLPAAAAITFAVYQSNQQPWPASNLADHVALAAPTLGFYLSKLAVPIGLCFEYPPLHSELIPRFWPLLLAVPLAILAIFWLARCKLSRGPFTACAFFIVTLLPTLGLLGNITWGQSAVADRYQHLACIGPIALVVAALALALRRALSAGWLVHPEIPAAAAAIVGVLALLGMVRSAVFHDDARLWRDVWLKNPNSYTAAEQNGEAERSLAGITSNPQERARLLDLAIRWYHAALKVNPKDASAILDEGLATEMQGNVDAAAALYLKAIAIKPDLGQAHLALGTVLYNRGNLEAAEQEFRAAVQLAPNLQPARAKLGGLLSQTAGKDSNRLQEAADQLAEARRLDPDDLQSLNEATRVAFEMHDPDLASALMAEVGRRDPTNISMRINLAISLFSTGRPAEAEIILLKVVHDSPNSADAQQDLGDVEMRLGQWRPAARHLQRAMELDKSRKALAKILAEAKRNAATQPASTQPDEPTFQSPTLNPN